MQVRQHRAAARRDDELARDRGVRGRGLRVDVPRQCQAAEGGRQHLGRRGRRRRQAQDRGDVPHRRVPRARRGRPRQGRCNEQAG